MIIIIAIIFAFLLILPRSCQSFMTVPKRLCVISHVCSFSEDLAKQKALNKIKGVVGSSGTNTPIMPKIRHVNPRMIKR